MAANPSIQLGTDGNWAIKEDNLLAYKKDGDRFFNKEFDFSRGSTATYVGRDGLIASAASGVPRIDFTNDTKGHLLLEPQSTNLVPYSEDFSQSEWFKLSSTVTPNTGTSPDGSQNAHNLHFDGTPNARLQVRIPTVNTKIYTFSIWIKKISANYTSNNKARIEGFNSGTVGILLLGDALNNAAVGEFIRYSVTTTASTGGTSFFQFRSDEEATFEVWGAQLEEGSLTSYIPTTGAASTRNADVCNNSGSAQDFNDSEGVLFAEIAALANDGTGRKITLNNGSNSNVLVLEYTSTSNQIRVFLSNGVLQFNEYITLSDLRLNTKFAIKYKVNDFALWVNGFELASDNIGTTFSDGTLSKINFDDGSGFADFYGKTKAVAVFKEALTDSELETLTSYTSFTDMANELNLTIK